MGRISPYYYLRFVIDSSIFWKSSELIKKIDMKLIWTQQLLISDGVPCIIVYLKNISFMVGIGQYIVIFLMNMSLIIEWFIRIIHKTIFGPYKCISLHVH